MNVAEAGSVNDRDKENVRPRKPAKKRVRKPLSAEAKAKQDQRNKDKR